MPKLDRAAREIAIALEANKLRAEYLARMREGSLPRLRADSSYGYTGIGMGQSRASGAKWAGGLSKPIGGRLTWHWGLAQQARDIAEDSIDAYNLIHRKADAVIDQGLTLSATPMADVLGMTDEEAQGWARKVTQGFDLWQSSTRQHRSGQFSFKQAQHQLEVGKARDNDEFVRFYYSGKSDLISPLQWEIIDRNQIRGDALTATNLMPIKYFDGIERNPDGTERAYKIWVQPPSTSTAPSPALVELTIPRIGEKSGRLMMIHGFQPEYAGQGRGYSQLGVSMQEWENLEDLRLSVIKKSINQSQLVAAIENKQMAPTNPFEQNGMPPAGPQVVQAFGATPAGGGLAIAGSVSQDNRTSFVPMEEAAFGIPGSTLVASMQQGDEMKYLQNTAPLPDFEAFVDDMLTPMVGSLGMSLELYKIKFDSSYSAARAGLAIVWRAIRMERQWLDTWCLSKAFEAWLSCEIAAGRISCPGWYDPRMREAYLCHRVIGTPPIQVDPEKEASANMKNLDMSITTLESLTHEYGTGDLEDNIARNKRHAGEIAVFPWAMKAAQAAPVKIVDGTQQGVMEPPKPAGFPAKPGQNGNGKPPVKAETVVLEPVDQTAKMAAALSRTIMDQGKDTAAALQAISDRVEAVQAIATAKPTPQPITVHSPPVTINEKPMTLEVHIHNDGATETTVENVELTPQGDIKSAIMRKHPVKVDK